MNAETRTTLLHAIDDVASTLRRMREMVEGAVLNEERLCTDVTLDNEIERHLTAVGGRPESRRWEER